MCNIIDHCVVRSVEAKGELVIQTVHVVPGRSAAASVKQAMKALRSRDRVIGVADHLGYGPIDGDLSVRRTWLDEHLGDGYGEEVDFAESDWRKALATDANPVIWTCRSDAGDYTGYLELLARIGDRPFDVIDATGLMLEGRGGSRRAAAVGVIAHDQMISSGLFDRRRTLTSGEITHDRETWRQIKAENAPLRVCENDVLLSKPLTYFDAELLDVATAEWERAARIVGAAMGRLMPRQLSDSFIWARYLAFAEDGLVEIYGDEDGGIRSCRLRRVEKS